MRVTAGHLCFVKQVFPPLVRSLHAVVAVRALWPLTSGLWSASSFALRPWPSVVPWPCAVAGLLHGFSLGLFLRPAGRLSPGFFLRSAMRTVFGALTGPLYAQRRPLLFALHPLQCALSGLPFRVLSGLVCAALPDLPVGALLPVRSVPAHCAALLSWSLRPSGLVSIWASPCALSQTVFWAASLRLPSSVSCVASVALLRAVVRAVSVASSGLRICCRLCPGVCCAAVSAVPFSSSLFGHAAVCFSRWG